METELKKSIITQFAVVIGVLLVTSLLGWQESMDVFKEDIGSIMMTIGVLWVFAIFLGFNALSEKICGIASGFSIFLFGFTLNEYGLSCAITTIGVYMIILTIIASPIILLKALFIIGIIVTVLGASLTAITKGSTINFFQPTKIFAPPEKIYDTETTVSSQDMATWSLKISYSSYNGVTTMPLAINGDSTFYGKEEDAKVEANKRALEWEKQDKTLRIIDAFPVFICK